MYSIRNFVHRIKTRKFISAVNTKNFNFTKCLYSKCAVDTYGKNNEFKVHIVPALTDNYMYVLVDKISKTAAAVDPVEPDKILRCVQDENVELKAILTTHHHVDHAGGNESLCEMVKDISVYGGDDRIPCLTNKLSHNERFNIGNLNILCLHTPCHTMGHVCYFVHILPNEYICFSGDTLFISGCGRFFEGSAEQMLKSLSILTSLPENTKIYCGHEYTLNNLKFALHVEPDNVAAEEMLKVSEEKIKKSLPTVPSTIKKELSYNPFLRVNQKSIQNFTRQQDPISVIDVLREIKNRF